MDVKSRIPGYDVRQISRISLIMHRRKCSSLLHYLLAGRMRDARARQPLMRALASLYKRTIPLGQRCVANAALTYQRHGPQLSSVFCRSTMLQGWVGESRRLMI